MEESYLITKELCLSCLYCQGRKEVQRFSCGYSQIESASRVYDSNGKRKVEKGYCCEYVKYDPDLSFEIQVKRNRLLKRKNDYMFGGN